MDLAVRWAAREVRCAVIGVRAGAAGLRGLVCAFHDDSKIQAPVNQGNRKLSQIFTGSAINVAFDGKSLG
jgi:hypothetical protein